MMFWVFINHNKCTQYLRCWGRGQSASLLIFYSGIGPYNVRVNEELCTCLCSLWCDWLFGTKPKSIHNLHTSVSLLSLQQWMPLSPSAFPVYPPSQFLRWHSGCLQAPHTKKNKGTVSCLSMTSGMLCSYLVWKGNILLTFAQILTGMFFKKALWMSVIKNTS